MTNEVTLKTIRTKKLGVLLRAARLTCEKGIDECAQAIGVSPRELEAYELGEQAPSLPELEMLAYFLQIPMEYYWGNELLTCDGHKQLPDIQQLRELRQRMIGVLVRKIRHQAGFSLEATAEQAGISPESLNAYELGEEAVPLPVLENLAKVLSISISEFQDKNGPVGTWFSQQQVVKEFLELPEEIQDFVIKPINLPYLEVARRLSEMQADRLRNLAEVLLEITL